MNFGIAGTVQSLAVIIGKQQIFLMKNVTTTICLLFCLLTYSCKKEVNTNNQNPSNTDLSLLFLDNAISDSCNENDFYIKGEFNGKKLCFATTSASGSYFADTFMNAFYVYLDTVKSDMLYLLRQNANQSIMIALYCGQTHITDRVFPYSQPHPNLEKCEFTELDFINMRSGSTATQNSPQDNYTFLGYTNSGMNLTFTSLTPDNIIEANFEGTARTNTGSVLTVKNGKLRIKFVVSETIITKTTAESRLHNRQLTGNQSATNHYQP
jgi:hypothetical protein